jgi:hypothetical protein
MFIFSHAHQSKQHGRKEESGRENATNKQA